MLSKTAVARANLEKLTADWLTRPLPHICLLRSDPSKLDNRALVHLWLWCNASLSLVFGFLNAAGWRLLESELLLQRLAGIRFASFEELIRQDPQVGISMVCIDLCLNGKNCDEELERRIAGRPIGMSLFLRDVEPLQLAKVLRVDRIRSYQPWREETKDIEHSGILLALEIYKELGDSRRERRPLPPIPQCDNPKEAEAFRYLRKTYEEEAARLTAELLPILEGDTEAIRGKVRDAQREVWRKQRRQQTILRRADRFPTGNDAEEVLEAVSAYRFFQRRWGQRGTAFLKAILHKKTTEEAAKKAGISRSTGEKYLKVFKENMQK
jgi:hypothetical protein